MKALCGLLAALFLGSCGVAMAIEEAAYKVIRSEKNLELRDYSAHIIAETLVDGDLEDAGSKAFRRLFKYISGENRSRTKVAMTAPVTQEAEGEKISMTAPVGQQRVEGKWAVSFMMPAAYTMETLPEPLDPSVVLRQVPQRKMAVVRYSGLWSEKNYLENRQVLEKWIKETGLTKAGDPIWARYNPPITPWFMRRNEIMIPVKSESLP
jgi:hypothetical protein